ncbi:hypothetical protein Syun_011693 [Stephania yunnanensis]|uniref:Uncharacterized protein n=1 Tax=Stephania yunnanensis TaxID=152371 RepID=A0AAP0JZ87_9MAGN
MADVAMVTYSVPVEEDPMVINSYVLKKYFKFNCLFKNSSKTNAKLRRIRLPLFIFFNKKIYGGLFGGGQGDMARR